VRDPIVMNHPAIAGQEDKTVERASYRQVWYPLGWRSDDDADYAGPLAPTPTSVPARLTALEQGHARRWSELAPAKGAVCFIWDDGLATFMDVADINDARGQQATFAITTGLVGSSANYVTAAQVRELEARGHEIAAHGSQHTTGLPSRTAAQRSAEYEACLDWFPANGVTRPTTWVYTFGSGTGRSDDTDRELMGRVDRVFDTNGSFPDLCAQRRDAPQFVMPRLQLEADSLQAKGGGERLIRLAAQQPVVVSFYMHGLGNAANQLSAAEYIHYADLAAELGLPVLTARDAFPASGDMLVDGGFELQATDQVWQTQTGAGSTASVIDDTPVVGLPGTKSLSLFAVEAGFSFARAFQTVPVRSGVVYTLSGRYRTSAAAGGSSVKTRATWLDYKGATIGTATTTDLAQATSWTRFTHDYTAPATAVWVQVDLLVDPPGGVTDATGIFDHVCLMPKYAGAFG